MSGIPTQKSMARIRFGFTVASATILSTTAMSKSQVQFSSKQDE